MAWLPLKIPSLKFVPPGQYPVVGQGWNYCAPTKINDLPPGLFGPHQSAVIDGNPLLWTFPKACWVHQWTKVVQARPNKSQQQIAGKKGRTACEVQVTTGNGYVAMIVGEKRLNTQSVDTKKKKLKEKASIAATKMIRTAKFIIRRAA